MVQEILNEFKGTNCCIISIYSFPAGLAPTNKILAISKGLVENGAGVDLFIPFPTDNKSTNVTFNDRSGFYQGISYNYTSGRFKSKYKIFRAFAVMSGLRKCLGYITSCLQIYQTNKKKKYNCILIYTDAIISLLIYSLLAKSLKASSVFIFDEFPIPIRHKLKTKIPRWKEYLYKKTLKNIDAYISISEDLKTYFNSICPKKTLVLSVIVDVSRFNREEKQIKELVSIKYLCYMGNMELSKDDVDNIIKAFAIICKKYTFLKLFLYGSPSTYTINYLTKLITSFDLKNRVFFKGKVNSEIVPQILRQAYILVSSQPNTKRASGGFPTKLGEYLASGVPALLTDVGDNSKYVKDNVHLFFTKPDDPNAYAEKLSYIIENYSLAQVIAENGKQYLYNNYSHIKKGHELLEFITNI